MRTLVPKSLWSCLSKPIPGSTRAKHRAMLGLALEERVKHLDKAVHQAHDWLCSNPLPWDPILWAHPSDPLNPFSVSHGAFSTSARMPPRTRPVYQHPPPLPKHALKKPSKPASAKAQPTTRTARPAVHRPLSPPHPHAPRHATVKHAYLSPLGPPLLGAQARLPLPPPTPMPPRTSEIFSAHPAIFCLLLSTPSALRPFPNPPPPPQGKSAFILPNHQSSRVHIFICCCKYFHWGTSAPEQVDAVKNIQKKTYSGLRRYANGDTRRPPSDGTPQRTGPPSSPWRTSKLGGRYTTTPCPGWATPRGPCSSCSPRTLQPRCARSWTATKGCERYGRQSRTAPHWPSSTGTPQTGANGMSWRPTSPGATFTWQPPLRGTPARRGTTSSPPSTTTGFSPTTRGGRSSRRRSAGTTGAASAPACWISGTPSDRGGTTSGSAISTLGCRPPTFHTPAGM